MTRFTIILPLACLSTRFAGTRPKWMLVAPDGELMISKALASVAQYGNGRVVCGVLRDHDERYGIQAGLRRAFQDSEIKMDIVVLPRETMGPADTVAQVICGAGITGPILVKDSDSWFKCLQPPRPNSVAVAQLSNNPSVTNVAAKSFVQLNKHMLVTAIMEKTVCSDFISVGGYAFEDARAYLQIFEKTKAVVVPSELFISHIVLQAITDGLAFHASPVQDYVDVGTIQAWNAFRNKHATLFVDVDGVLLKNSGAFFGRLWDDQEELLEGNVRLLKSLIEEGAQIILISARPERYRQQIEARLKNAGLTWSAFILNCLHSRRYLINDYAPSNPYPAAVAVNVRRDSDDLADYFPHTL